MSIPSNQVLIAEVGLAAFAGRVPEDVRNQVEIRFKRIGQSFILFTWRSKVMNPAEWYEFEVAKFTYVQKSGTWKLFWIDRNSRWRRNPTLPESDISRLLQEVDEDPYCLFWG